MRYQVFSGSDCPLLNIDCIGYAADPLVTRFDPAVRESYIVHYVLSGKGYFNGRPVGKGQGFLITPKMEEHYYPDTHEPWRFVYVISSDAAMAKLFSLYGASTDHIFRYEACERMENVAKQLTSAQNRRYTGFEMLALFLEIWNAGNAPSMGKAPSSAELYVQEAVRYIQTNLHRAVTVGELTDFLGIGQPYLFRLFKERFGQSPKQYIQEARLAYAKRLLRETERR